MVVGSVCVVVGGVRVVVGGVLVVDVDVVVVDAGEGVGLFTQASISSFNIKLLTSSDKNSMNTERALFSVRSMSYLSDSPGLMFCKHTTGSNMYKQQT